MILNEKEQKYCALVKTSYSIFREGSSTKFKIAALLSQSEIITNFLANQIGQKKATISNLVEDPSMKIE